MTHPLRTLAARLVKPRTSRRAHSRGRRWAVVAVTLAVSVTLAGCTADPSGSGDAPGGATDNEQRFVAGDGSVTLVPPGDRKPAPEVEGETLDGGAFRLADHAGDVVVLNVWASWCAPCRAEAPGLERVWQDVRSSDVQFVGVDVKDSQGSARAFVRRFGITYPNLYDQPGRVPLAFGGTLPPAAIPSTLVIDRQGRVAARGLGGLTEGELRRVVDAVASEQPHG